MAHPPTTTELALDDAGAVAALGTILGIWAHPDDEAYLSAGLMAMATTNRQRVVVVHATLGEAGTPDPITFPPEHLRVVRAAEVTAALRAVGVNEHHVLGFPDGGCATVDRAEATGPIQRLIETIDPDTIVTFGPDGLTGHPDHRAVSAWTAAAHAAAGSRARLLHAAVTDEWAATNRDLNVRTGAFEPGLPVVVTDAALALTLSGPVLSRKVAALRAHRSQTEALEQLVGPQRYREWWATETFVDA